jgi:hypothetical protein
MRVSSNLAFTYKIGQIWKHNLILSLTNLSDYDCFFLNENTEPL